MQNLLRHARRERLQQVALLLKKLHQREMVLLSDQEQITFSKDDQFTDGGSCCHQFNQFRILGIQTQEIIILLHLYQRFAAATKGRKKDSTPPPANGS